MIDHKNPFQYVQCLEVNKQRRNSHGKLFQSGIWRDEILLRRRKINHSSKWPYSWRSPSDPARLTDAAAVNNRLGMMIIVILVHY
jgi:hypothetical protein